MMPNHHPGEDMLWEYVTGTMREPVAVVTATHLALCPICRGEVHRLETIAGSLFESVDPEDVESDLLDRTIGRLETNQDAVGAAETVDQPADPTVPRPLRDYLPGPLDTLHWDARRHGPARVRLLPEAEGFDVRLLKIEAGAAMPRHGHAGHEFTLVLNGGFSDASGRYGRGDLAIADPSVDHAPIADGDEDCICLAVTDAPLRLTGRFGRLLNPFVKY